MIMVRLICIANKFVNGARRNATWHQAEGHGVMIRTTCAPWAELVGVELHTITSIALLQIAQVGPCD